MTIRKGQEWGRVGALPAGAATAGSDAELFALVNAAALPAAVRLTGGDLFRTLGGPSGSPAGDLVVIAPVDLAVVHHDGGSHRFAAHAVVRRSWWRGRIVGLFNAQYLGPWDVAPRSHPNDGRLDLVEVAADMGARQRWGARSRLPTGSYLPHPLIATRSLRAGEWRFDRPMVLRLDGVEVGETRGVRVEVEPDALTVCV